MRAQIGSSKEPVGVLPVLHDAGLDSKALRERFRRRFGVDDDQALDRFVRGGIYRYTTDFRRVYASVLKHAYRLDPKPVLGDFEPLELFA